MGARSSGHPPPFPFNRPSMVCPARRRTLPWLSPPTFRPERPERKRVRPVVPPGCGGLQGSHKRCYDCLWISLREMGHLSSSPGWLSPTMFSWAGLRGHWATCAGRGYATEPIAQLGRSIATPGLRRAGLYPRKHHFVPILRRPILQ